MQTKSFVRTFIIFFAVIVFANGISYADGAPPLTHKLTKISQSIMAPALRFKNMDDEIVDIKDLRGKVVIVNFWATWCPPCRREMGSLERLHQATKDKNIVILAVNIGEDVDTVFPFMGTVEPSPSFPVLFDTDAAAMKPWNVNGLPTTYFIKPDGTIAYRAVGGREFDHPDILQKTIALAQ